MGLFNWHKRLTDNFIGRFGVDWYAVAWIAWFKGLITGFIIYHFLLM